MLDELSWSEHTQVTKTENFAPQKSPLRTPPCQPLPPTKDKPLSDLQQHRSVLPDVVSLKFRNFI